MAESLRFPLLLGVVAAAFVADVAVFIFMRRLQPEARRGRAHAAGLLAGLLAVVSACLVMPQERGILLLPALAMSVCNAYILFHLDNMAETARRIRILRELHEAGGGLRRSEILHAYPPQEVFERRLARLTLAGQCRSHGGRLLPIGSAYSSLQWLVEIFARLVFGRGRSL